MNVQSQITSHGALAGVQVVDITTTVLGPVATQIPVDLGADVMKIEPSEGDPMRYLGPPRNEGTAAMFLAMNCNKRSIVLDLKKQESAEVLERLLAKADVVVHNRRPNAAERLGISYAHLSAMNPRLVYASASGTTANWIEAFNHVDLPNGPVNELEDLFDSTYLHETGFFNKYNHPSEGRLVATNPAVNFSRTPSGMRRPPPRLGEHTCEVMERAGFFEREISVIGSHQQLHPAQQATKTTPGEL